MATKAFGGDIQRQGRVGHRAQGLADKVLAAVVAVERGGVEVGDAGAAGGVQQLDGPGGLAGVGQAHAAESDCRQSFAGCAAGVGDHNILIKTGFDA
ncbi:MAG: hypothetical protein PHI39_03315 [Kiritimatiellae bacterium]|nr:hypothetical protein [Kiritimatiellia bacterium]